MVAEYFSPAETESSPEQVSQLVTAVIQEDLLYSLAHSIHLLPFESRKDTQSIFSYVLRFKPPNSSSSEPPALSYVINSRPEVIIELCRGYAHRGSAMPCGVVLREILKHESIAAIVLYDQSKENERAVNIDHIDVDVKQSGEGVFWKFFPWIDGGAFEVTTDAFTTFRVSHFDPGTDCLKLLIKGAGDSYQTQTARGAVSFYQFRSFFPKLQYYPGSIEFLCYKEAIYQTLRRASS